GQTFMPEGGPSLGGDDGSDMKCDEEPETDPDKADPVNCGSGAFKYGVTDLAVNDLAPTGFRRLYNSRDTHLRAFGRGMSHAYGMSLRDPTATCNDTVGSLALTLVNGSAVQFPFVRTLLYGSADSPTGYLVHKASPSRFYGATLRVAWPVGPLAALTLKDGTV